VTALVERGAGAGSGRRTRGESPVFSDTSRWIAVVGGGFKLIAPSRRRRFPTRKERLRHALHRAKIRWASRGGSGVELFDLRSDPGERFNIARREKGVGKELLEAADRYYREKPAHWADASDLTAAEEEQVRKELDGLGYL
jgi:hypothetical protein